MTPEEIVAWHAANVGIGGATDAAAALLFPNDSRAWALSYLSGWTDTKGHHFPSTCELYAMAYLRASGVSTPDLDRGYEHQPSMAPKIFEEAARSVGAWSTDPDDLATFPEIGDVVRLGGLGVGELHVLCVTGSAADTGAIVSVEGGQLPDSTYVQRRERLLVIWHGDPWLVKPETPYLPNGMPNGRPVTARVIGSRLL